MTLESMLSLALFSFASSITPGPNNFMLLASGVNFGFRRTVPHMFGVAFGFCLLLLAVGAGLGGLLKAYPVVETAFKAAGGAYLLFLSWKIAMARSLGRGGEAASRPITLQQAAAFQFVNPKAWVMAITGMAIYTDAERPWISVTMIAAVFTVVNLPSIAVWAGFGVALRNWLSDPVRLKWFNIGMGVLLAATLAPLLR